LLACLLLFSLLFVRLRRLTLRVVPARVVRVSLNVLILRVPLFRAFCVAFVRVVFVAVTYSVAMPILPALCAVTRVLVCGYRLLRVALPCARFALFAVRVILRCVILVPSFMCCLVVLRSALPCCCYARCHCSFVDAVAIVVRSCRALELFTQFVYYVVWCIWCLCCRLLNRCDALLPLELFAIVVTRVAFVRLPLFVSVDCSVRVDARSVRCLR